MQCKLSNSENERNCATELILVKIFKEGLVFLVTKTLKYINKNLSLKIEMVFYNSLSHLKPISHFVPMLPNIQEPSSCVRNPPQ